VTKNEAAAVFVYRVDSMDLDGFSKAKLNSDYEIGDCVAAALAIRKSGKLEKDSADWDGSGDYWFSPIPGKKLKCVVARPNPYGEGYVVSPVEMPWLEAKSK
jgi:hypothetical protein